MKKRTKVVGGIVGAVVLFYFLLMFIAVNVNYVGTDAPVSVMARPPAKSEAAPVEPLKDHHGAIDQILEKLQFGNIAFNVPKKINFHDTAIIQLVLGLEAPIDELKRVISAMGEKEGVRTRVSGRMEARLSGPNFSVTAITPEIQAVPRSDIVEWKWEVRPISDGRHYLHLTLSVLLSVDGVSTPLAIRTFDKVIVVEVGWHQRASSFFDKNWQWLWAVILVPMVGWLWKKEKGSKPEVNQSDS